MKSDEIRGLDDVALAEELEASRKELMNLRFRTATKQISNTSGLKDARRNIARILTIMRARELQRG
jgi:large subunit ribosomal protein L29